jgi:anti-sigma28 factor (negative regulator of flagellin synthesis)
MSLERLQKLERLRRAISRGTYQVSAILIAQKMIAGFDGDLH